ncbi:MAG: GAF domain-containing protein [Acidobacteria bacterium]|nr:GAF domain-containing protein [Acidobacteriota bacterium]
MTLPERVQEALERGGGLEEALGLIIARFGAEGGTIHMLEPDGLLHLQAASRGMPAVVLDAVRTVPPGKGMAGLAAERRQPVNVCNLQTDSSGDVRPGAKATGFAGAVAVPILDGERAVGALGIGQRGERVFSEAECALLIEAGRAIAARLQAAASRR